MTPSSPSDWACKVPESTSANVALGIHLVRNLEVWEKVVGGRGAVRISREIDPMYGRSGHVHDT